MSESAPPPSDAPPRRAITRGKSEKAAADAVAAFAAKKKAAIEKAASLKTERNMKKQLQEEFEKAMEGAGETLVTNWTNDGFAKQAPPRKSLSPRGGPKTPSASPGGRGGGFGAPPKLSLSPGERDAKMRSKIQKLEADRLARRQAQSNVKGERAAALAEHPGMDPNDVAFLLMVNRWREETLRSLGGGHGGGGASSDRHNGGGAKAADATSIRCCIRKRPLLPKEIANKVFDVVSCASHGAMPEEVVLHEPREKVIENDGVGGWFRF
jgi:hypothetical protein